MILAHTRLLVPKTLPSKREAVNSTAKVVIPEEKTARTSAAGPPGREAPAGRFGEAAGRSTVLREQVRVWGAPLGFPRSAEGLRGNRDFAVGFCPDV